MACYIISLRQHVCMYVDNQISLSFLCVFELLSLIIDFFFDIPVHSSYCDEMQLVEHMATTDSTLALQL